MSDLKTIETHQLVTACGGTLKRPPPAAAEDAASDQGPCTNIARSAATSLMSDLDLSGATNQSQRNYDVANHDFMTTCNALIGKLRTPQN